MSHTSAEKVMRFIREYIDQHGYPPSQQEIAEGCNYSRDTVGSYLYHLHKQGRVKSSPGKVRSLQIMNA